MLKELKPKKPLIIGSGLLLLTLLTLIGLSPQLIQWLEQRNQAKVEQLFEQESQKPSAVLSLVGLSPEERKTKLQEIADSPRLSLDRNRARYLLAVDLINQYEGGPALRQLEGLEKDYPLLTPYILLKRGRAYELTNESLQAQQTWKKLIEEYPDSLVVPEALYQLGSDDPQYWDQAIKTFPYHPRTHDIIRQRLKDNAKQPELLLLLAKYDADNPSTTEVRDRLVKDYASQLTPEDWQIIADGYWEQGLYKKAAQAYTKSPKTPQNRYRLGRSWQLSDQKKAAITAYQQLTKGFPDAPETATALKQLANLSPASEAIAYLDRIIQTFRDQAPDALLRKADLLNASGRKQEATQAREVLLKNYAKSDAAAEYRWTVAQNYAKSGDLLKAWSWAQPITTLTPESDLAPKAGFWVGKWARQLGKTQEAEMAFKHVLARHPQSYYAWRSAVLLGLNVGDFNSVRFQSPTLTLPTVRPLPPAGSLIFQELYRLGLDQEAVTLFRAETGDQETLSVDEQFTDALLKLAQGQNLQGINQVWYLNKAEDAQDQKQWQTLRQTDDYWHALFPFPFNNTIVEWAAQRELNPLLVTSLIRQESRFEPEIRSPAGATGLMQVMPATGDWIAPKINLKSYSLTDVNDNVNLGTWYLDYTHKEYDNNSLLAVASYNAGPGNVAKWMREFQERDPDEFVEKIPFGETKGYVETVFGNYWNYLRIYNPDIAQLLAQYEGK